MKKIFLFALLITPVLHCSWQGVTAKSQLSSINNAQNQTAFTSALQNVYAKYGDPNTAFQGLRFLETAFELWQTRFGTTPFYTYNTFLQQQAASLPTKQTPQPVAPQPVTPQPAPVVTQVLTPNVFFEQLTQQVTQSLNLLQTSLQDPVLSQAITRTQITTLQNSITALTTTLSKQGSV